jgi:hypothetical protein
MASLYREAGDKKSVPRKESRSYLDGSHGSACATTLSFERLVKVGQWRRQRYRIGFCLRRPGLGMLFEILVKCPGELDAEQLL